MDRKALLTTFPEIVFFPGSPEYAESNGSYFSAFERELSPTCVVRPRNAEEVANIVKAFRSSALSGHTQLAIKGGGHAAWAGSANIDNGITIDLRNLTGVHVDSYTKIASLGAGERWRNVYETLGTQGLAVVGGRMSRVGVAGLITGGLSQTCHGCKNSLTSR
jgi:FAD/FMN-containing dehydrogenase